VVPEPARPARRANPHSPLRSELHALERQDGRQAHGAVVRARPRDGAAGAGAGWLGAEGWAPRADPASSPPRVHACAWWRWAAMLGRCMRGTAPTAPPPTHRRQGEPHHHGAGGRLLARHLTRRRRRLVFAACSFHPACCAWLSLQAAEPWPMFATSFPCLWPRASGLQSPALPVAVPFPGRPAVWCAQPQSSPMVLSTLRGSPQLGPPRGRGAGHERGASARAAGHAQWRPRACAHTPSLLHGRYCTTTVQSSHTLDRPCVSERHLPPARSEAARTQPTTTTRHNAEFTSHQICISLSVQ
jgi:hypothetical protein